MSVANRLADDITTAATYVGSEAKKSYGEYQRNREEEKKEHD